MKAIEKFLKYENILRIGALWCGHLYPSQHFTSCCEIACREHELADHSSIIVMRNNLLFTLLVVTEWWLKIVRFSRNVLEWPAARKIINKKCSLKF